MLFEAGRKSSKEGLIPDPLAEEKCYLCVREKVTTFVPVLAFPSKNATTWIRKRL